MLNEGQAHSGFREDINGLRAYAVTAVILYHFGIPALSGGFIGVDLFFVISGFLMTSIVIKGLERETFSVINFYLARARRILPALLILCITLLAIGWFLLPSTDYKQLSSHSVYAVLFLSNIEFWKEAGYFDIASHEKWFLHTWSLSVEWQFYLILPLFQWFVWHIKPGRVAQIWALTFGLILSFITSIWLTHSKPTAAFFLLHSRAWEMLAGGLVFLIAPYINLSKSIRNVFEITGISFILLSIVFFNKETDWPGWRAALPVVATMLVLLANRNSGFTSNKLAQWLGDRSYSLYLWHWPVVVSLGYGGQQEQPIAIVIGLVITLFLGHFSFIWVENPARQFLQQKDVKFSSAVIALNMLIVILPAVAIWKLSGVPGRVAPSVELAAAESKNWNPRREECHLSEGISIPNCVYGGKEWNVVVVGDSHVNAIITSLAQASPRDSAGVVEWSYSGCSYVPGMKKLQQISNRLGGDKNKCAEFIEWVTNSVNALPTSIPIVIVNRYAQGAFGRNENKISDKPEVFFSKIYTQTNTEFLDEYSRHITDSACELAKQRDVYLVRPIPEIGFDVPRTLSRRMAMGFTEDLSISYEDYQARNGWVWKAQDIAREKCGVKILDPTAYLCRNGLCYASQDGRPLYYDDDHLSEFGNQILHPMFAEIYKSK